jgi:hypothetical protein
MAKLYSAIICRMVNVKRFVLEKEKENRHYSRIHIAFVNKHFEMHYFYHTKSKSA